jgi:hypothetical protein
MIAKLLLHSLYMCMLLQAMQLVDVMSEVGVSHDDVTWHTLLSAAKHLGRPDVAEMVSHLFRRCA